MIVLEDKAESPSTQRASTAYSSQCQLRQSNRFETAENSKQRGLPGEALTAHSAHWPTSDSNDRPIVRSHSDGTLDEKTIPFGLPSKVAAAVLFTLTTIAVAGAISSASEAGVAPRLPNELTIEIQPALAQQLRQEDAVEQTVSLAPPNTSPALAAANPRTADDASTTALNAVVGELLATRQLANDYLDEINWLQSHSSQLQQKVDDLDDETLALNQELLQLELTVATLEADAKPQVQVQTVYNFVDVPIGHSVEEVYYDPAATENYNDLAGPEPASLQPEGYEDPDSLYADDYYRDYDNAPQQNELLYDNSHEVYVADYPDEPPYPPRHYRQYNDPQAIDGRFLNDEGMLDHESGYYTHE